MTESIADSPSESGRTAVPRRLRVCVAVPTYRRPEMLERLLDGIARLLVPEHIELDVIVIDNDVEPSARELVTSRIAGFSGALSYHHLRQPGLSAVRNFALAHSGNRFDFLAMIDDDEVPESQWLAELLRVQDKTQADVVIGPVPREIPATAPQWLRNGHFFDLPVYRDGAPMSDGYSGNCLLRVSAIAAAGVTFDASLNFAGGEDLLFFRDLKRRGCTLVYAAAAIAHESVEPRRLTASYVLQLNFRRGNTLALCDVRLGDDARATVLRSVKACGCVVRGIVSLAPLALLRGRIGAMQALCDIARGIGGLAGLSGYTYDMYRRSTRAQE